MNRTKTDAQGNPVDERGQLIIERLSSMDELTDKDFLNPYRNIMVPPIPENVDRALGAFGRPIIIKKNVFEKNTNRHPEIKPAESRRILIRALYSPNWIGTAQPLTRPDYKVVIYIKAPLHSVVVLDVFLGKENVEIVGWRRIRTKSLGAMKKRAEREGGLFLILSSQGDFAAGLSDVPFDSSLQ